MIGEGKKACAGMPLEISSERSTRTVPRSVRAGEGSAAVVMSPPRGPANIGLAASILSPVIEIEGKQVFTELEELVDPRHTALLVVDMQRDFCVPGWAFDRLGVDISMYPSLIPRLARMIEG